MGKNIKVHIRKATFYSTGYIKDKLAHIIENNLYYVGFTYIKYTKYIPKNIIKILLYILDVRNIENKKEEETVQKNFTTKKCIRINIKCKCEIKYNFTLLVNHSNQCKGLNKKADILADFIIKSWEEFRLLYMDKLNEKKGLKNLKCQKNF